MGVEHMDLETLFIYLFATFSAFVANTIPAFAPPTWIVLSLFKISHPELNSLILASLGVVGSVTGRFAMYLYSKALGRYIPQRYMGNINYFKKVIEKKRRGLFLGSFAYSLSPLPSNFLFIGSGLSGIKVLRMLAGFSVGRVISYALLVHGFYKTFSLIEVFGTGNVLLFGNLLGIGLAASMIFIDMKKILGRIMSIVHFIGNKLGFQSIMHNPKSFSG